MADRQKGSAISGLLIVNKDGGLSSQAVVTRVKRLLGADKAGHTGTLDPMATGVLPVLVGRAVKASEFMLTADKHYGATLLLGITTDTEDVTGETLSTHSGELPSEGEVVRTVESFVGEYLQTPPMYSALKVGGQKLCDLARKGVTVEREPRLVRIYSIDCKKLSDVEYYLDVKCSKGTYIRTLCADIGARLGVGGVMKTLERLSASGYSLGDAVTLGELEEMDINERLDRLRPVEEVFLSLKRIDLAPFFARLARAGQEIYLKKIHEELPLGERVRLYDGESFFAVGEVREYEGGCAIKPIRSF